MRSRIYKSNSLLVICLMACVIFVLSGCDNGTEERSLTLISNVSKNGSYDMSNFCFYALLNNRADDIVKEYNEEGKCIKETNPGVSYAVLEYSGNNKVRVKVYELSEISEGENLIGESDFEFGDAIHAKAKWKTINIEDNSVLEGYYMFEFDQEGRKTYTAKYVDNSLYEYKEFYYTDDDYKFYTYDSKGALLTCNEYVKDGLVESNNQYSADGTLEMGDTKEYYESGNLKSHKRIDGKQSETTEYNENGILAKSVIYYDNGNISSVKEYDNNGYLIKNTYYGYTGELEYCYEYTNDEYGYPTYARMESFVDNVVEESYYENTYVFDDEGKIVEAKVYDNEGKFIEGYTYAYDAEGNLAERMYIQN